MHVPFRLTVMAAVGGVAVGALITWSVAVPSHAAPSTHAAAVALREKPHKRAQPVVSAPPAKPPLVVTGAPSNVQLKAGALDDAATGTLLWSQGLNTELPMGSITKVMTALVVIDSGPLTREIQVPQSVIAYVNQYGGNSAGLQPGDVLTAQELLEAMLLPSGCDAAYTLAMAYGPGMPAFLAKMNAMAKKLGMLHTEFTSPDGLPYPTEYSTFSTPADLITLGQAAMASPAFSSIVAQQNYTLPAGPGHHAYSWANDNSLIGSYPGADGIKTGYTNAALHCLLFEASRDGLTLIGVVLGAPATGPDSGAQQAAQILNWGFSLRRT
jgi:serine-type D-Ala-D-Ala carboxypeptidase (penicillin-binding protein 5/6)